MKALSKWFVLVIVFALLLVMTTTVLAETDIQDSGNTGGGGNEIRTGRYTWDTRFSGYRFAIVDKNLNQVSNTIDILYSNPHQTVYGIGWGPDRRDFYTTTRARNASNQFQRKEIFFSYLKKEGIIDSYPQYPIYSQHIGDGKYISRAGGEQFKNWFLAGKDSLTDMYEETNRRNIRQQTWGGTLLDVTDDILFPSY